MTRDLAITLLWFLAAAGYGGLLATTEFVLRPASPWSSAMFWLVVLGAGAMFVLGYLALFTKEA